MSCLSLSGPHWQRQWRLFLGGLFNTGSLGLRPDGRTLIDWGGCRKIEEAAGRDGYLAFLDAHRRLMEYTAVDFNRRVKDYIDEVVDYMVLRPHRPKIRVGRLVVS